MKTIEELKQEIIELKQQLESTTIALSRVHSTTIAEDRQKLQKQILGMIIELADLHRSESAYD
jgi:cell division septum initiation protein DivIVA